MLNERQLSVLRHLRKEARKHFMQISRETNIPVTTVFDQYRRLRKVAITKEVCLLNYKYLGYTLRSYFIADCESRRILLKFLNIEKRVNNLFLVGTKTILFEAVFKDEGEKNEFIDNLESYRIRELKELSISDEIKSESFIP